MSARLAKLSTNYSYQLNFCENELPVMNLEARNVLIIDMDSVRKEEFHKSAHLLNNDSVFIIGYALKVDIAKIKYFRGMGYDMVLRRNKLLKNLNTILQKIINND